MVTKKKLREENEELRRKVRQHELDVLYSQMADDRNGWVWDQYELLKSGVTEFLHETRATVYLPGGELDVEKFLADMDILRADREAREVYEKADEIRETLRND